MRTQFTALFYGLAVGSAITATVFLRYQPKAIVRENTAVMSIGDSQRALKDLGFYKGEIDYIWGPNTERAYCDWEAQKWFDSNSYEKGAKL